MKNRSVNAPASVWSGSSMTERLEAATLKSRRALSAPGKSFKCSCTRYAKTPPITATATITAITAGLSRILRQLGFASGMRFSFANHSATCASTGMARTSFATAASNACCCENDGACFPCRARWIATRIARSMPGFSVIGAQANSVSGLVGIEKRCLVVGRSRIEPRLKLPARARKQVRELGGFYFQKREHFAERELIEIEKRERAPLRFRSR